MTLTTTWEGPRLDSPLMAIMFYVNLQEKFKAMPMPDGIGNWIDSC